MIQPWLLTILMIGASAQAKQKTVKKTMAAPAKKSAVAPATPTAPTTLVVSALQKPVVKANRFATRHGIALDYNSWFENIKITGGTPFQTKALLYGIGLTYEYNKLRSSWGWGVGAGWVHGFAVSGDATDTTTYYSKRVPLEIARFNSRIFLRINPRFDAGILACALYTITNWPTSNGFNVDKAGSLMMGGFLDTRWRLDGQWEIIQAFGTYNTGPSLAWRMGTSYYF